MRKCNTTIMYFYDPQSIFAFILNLVEYAAILYNVFKEQPLCEKFTQCGNKNEDIKLSASIHILNE